MKTTALERAIANLDDKIAALQLARQHLVDQQPKAPKANRPRPVVKEEKVG
jgi:hypothetical protein